MKLELQAIATSSIKRKKPWPRLAWIGERHESILLIDRQRLSILYIPSGKTERRLPQLHPFLPQVSTINCSNNGHFVCGLLKGGDLFLWHKDTNVLRYVQGRTEFSASPQNRGITEVQLFVSDTGSEILVVLPVEGKVYLWQKGRAQYVLSTEYLLEGQWMQIGAPQRVTMPGRDHTVSSVSAVFVFDDVIGRSCCCSFVFVEGSVIVVTSVWLRWNSPDVSPGIGNNMQCDWTCLRYNVENTIPAPQTLRIPGSLVAVHTRDGHLLAIAINSSCSHDNRMMYVSTISDVVVMANMKGSGAKAPVSNQAAQMYWVKDMQWTWDDLFLVCMIGQGSLCVLPRLGEPVLLRTYGNSLEMGPRYFLPILPVVNVPGMEEHNDIMRQRFSVAPHPRLPLFLCSDGYMVTAFQLPGETSCLHLLKGLTMEAGTHLRQVHVKRRFSDVMAGLSPYHQLRAHNTRDFTPSAVREMRERQSVIYEFEMPEDEAALDDGSDDEMLDLVTRQNNMAPQRVPDHGQVIIGDAENMNTTRELLEAEVEVTNVVDVIKRAYCALSHAWTLAASHSGFWTQHHEDTALHLMRHACSLIALILNSDPKTATRLSNKDNIPPVRAKLSHALAVLQQFFSLLKLDSISCNLVATALHMSHNVLKIFMKRLNSGKQELRMHRLHGCHMLLMYMERSLINVYGRKRSGVSTQCLVNYGDAYEPALFCQSPWRPRPEGGDNGDPSLMTSRDDVIYVAAKNCPGWVPGLDKLTRRMLPMWRTLYKQVVREWRRSLTASDGDDSWWTLRKMLVTLQGKMHILGFSVTSRKKCKVKPAKRLFIEGCPIPATQSWLQQLNKFKDVPENRLSHVLHSILYTLILQKELRQVIEFVEILIRHDDTQSAAALFRQDQQTKLSVLSLVHQKTPPDILDPPPSYIRSVAVLQLVQSLGRVMAAYFTNSTVFVYPPHTPRRIPPLHLKSPIGDRILPLYSGHLSAVIRQAGLDRVWTVERCMEYLVISGLFSEAVWFSLRLGDWKTAFIVASVCEHRLLWHKERGSSEKFLKFLKLPEALSAGAIMKEQLQSVLSLVLSDKSVSLDENNHTSPETLELKRYVQDMVLGCTVMGVNLTPWLLDTLIGKAKTLFSSLSPLIPAGFYLPAPPVYCPQPALPAQEECGEDVYSEFILRNEIHQVLQTILLVLSASNCLLPSARWYLTRVLQAVGVATSAKSEEFELNKEDMPFLYEFLEDVKSPFQGEENEPVIHDVLAAFRDVCSLVWLAHARDNLSKAVREKSALAEQMFKENREIERSAWTSKCYACLMWATSLCTFCEFLGGQEDIYGLLLSTVMELPATVEIAMTVAVHLPDTDDLSPDVESKVQVLLKSWQGVFLQEERTSRASIKVDGHPGKSPRGTSLTSFYHKHAEKMRQTLKNKQKMFGMYEPQVFSSQDSPQGVENGINYVGARPFESELGFLGFLDMFYAICLNKEVEKVNEKRHVKPFLVPYVDEIRLQELDFMAYKAVANLQKRQSTSSSQNTPFRLSLQLSKLLTKGPSVDSQPPRNSRGRGLFRSRSFNDALSDWGDQSRGPQLGLVVDQRSISHSALDSVGLDSRNRPPRDHYRQKLRSKSANRQKDLVTQVSVPLQRSTSVDSQLSQEERVSDPLSKPLFSAALLDAMVFGPKYDQVESLVNWLTMWSGKYHKLNIQEKMRCCPAIHINMHRRLTVYALWEIEHFYYPRWGPSRLVQAQDQASQAPLSSSQDLGKVPSAAENTQPKVVRRAKLKPPSSPRENRSQNNRDSDRASAGLPQDEEHQRNIREFISLLDDSESPRTKKKSKKKEQPKKQLTFAPEEKKEVTEDQMQPSHRSYEEVAPKQRKEKKEVAEDHVQPSHRSYEEVAPKQRKEKKEVTEDHMQPSHRSYEEVAPKQRTAKTEEYPQRTILAAKQRTGKTEEVPQRMVLAPKRQTEKTEEVVVPQSIASESSLNISSLNEDDLKAITRPSRSPQPNQSPRPDWSSQPPRSPQPNRSPQPTRSPLPTRSTQPKRAVQEDIPDAVTTELKPVKPEQKPEQKPEMKTNGQVVDAGQMNDLAGTLRDIIRHEMARVMKAQYEGMMNGLGALQGPDSAPPGGKKPHHKNKPQGRDQEPKDDRRPTDPDESRDRSSTDFDVTPLPSDDPFTMSELERPSPVKDQRQPQLPLRVPLDELKHLQNNHHQPGPHPTQPPHHHPHVKNGMDYHPPHQPPAATHPPLLRLPTSGQRVNFPSIASPQQPQTVWRQPTPSTQSLPRMPSPPQRHLPDELPVRDTNDFPAVSAVAPSNWNDFRPGTTRHFPLLHMPGRPRMFSHIEDNNGIPRLVPPEDLMAYQKQRKMSEAEQDLQDAQMKDRIAKLHPRSSHLGQDSSDHRINSSPRADKGVDKEEMRPQVQVRKRVRRPREEKKEEEERKAQEEEKEVQEDEDVDEESVEIHPGHALTPGLFDEYLKQKPEDQEVPGETYAEVQLKVASMLKAARTNEMKRDTSMQTDPTMVHAGTTFSKDSGTDPIKEAIESYTRARRDLGAGGLLPPELFLGLQFPQQQQDAPHSASDSSGRAFINVVDLQGSALDDLISNMKEREDQVGMGRAEDLKGGEAEGEREGLALDDGGEEIHIKRADAVTERVLGRPSEMPLGVGEAGQGSHPKKTKQMLRGRLDDMDLQLDSMERMANRMEEDYKNTKLLVHTIDHIGEAIQPSEAAEPSAKVLQGASHSPPTKEEPEGKPLTPSDVQRLKLKDKAPPKMRRSEIEAEDGLTPEERLREIRSNLSQKQKQKDEHLNLEPDGTLNSEEASDEGSDLPEEKDQTPLSTRRSAWSDTNRTTKSELQNLYNKDVSHVEAEKRGAEEKERLQKYIAEKRAERMRQFRLKQEALREREARPFQMTADTGKLSTKDLEEKENKRVKEKLSREQEFAVRRQDLANRMMGELLSDRLDLPADQPVPSEKVPTRKKGGPRSVNNSKGPRHSSPVRKSQERNNLVVALGNLSDVIASHDTAPPRDQRWDQRVRWSDDALQDGVRTGTDSFTGMYTRQLEHMQTDTWESQEPSSAWASDSKQDKAKPSPIPEESIQTDTPQTKPLSELVRLQRPEITRRNKGYKTLPLSYTDRLAQMSGTFSQRSDPSASVKQRGQTVGKAPGSETTKTGARRAPRTVKTYTQRLQEMKQARHAAGPVARQPRYVAPASTAPARTVHQPLATRIKRRKPAKPMTYAEQLQKLQPPKELYRTEQGGHLSFGQQSSPRRHRYRAPHKPKTYAQQLQELQPHKAMLPGPSAAGMPRGPGPSQVLRTSLSKGQRSRPYTDPYADEDERSISSVTSAWKLEDNIRKLIYDDQTSYTEAMSVATTAGELSDLAELEYLAGEDYVTRVSINDLAEVGSMSSGSIMSFIDWDQVDDLIADIQ